MTTSPQERREYMWYESAAFGLMPQLQNKYIGNYSIKRSLDSIDRQLASKLKRV